MKVLLLSVCLISLSHFQQDGKNGQSAFSKPAEAAKAQPQKEVVQSTPFNAAYKITAADSVKGLSGTSVQTSPFSATHQQDPAAPKK